MALPDCHDGVKISLFLNHRCNLRCRYCYNGPPFDRPMTAEIARRAIDFAFEQADGRSLQLAFFGGEPLLEIARMEQAVEQARGRCAEPEALRFSLSTNATILDERRLRLIADEKMRVQVSIDGTEDAHRQRPFADGRSSWKPAFENLRRMLAAGVEVHVVAVVDPANAHLIPDSYDLFRDSGVRLVHFTPNLAASWDDDAKRRLDDGLAALADRWADSIRANHAVRLDPFHGKVAAQVMAGTFAPARCAFGCRELAISPRGRIYPCDRLVKSDDDDELCLGDLAAGIDEEKRRVIVAAREQIDSTCRSCHLKLRCAHSCACTNHEQTGHPGRVPAARCWWEKLVIAHADRVANQLYADRDPGFLRRFYGRFLVKMSNRHPNPSERGQ